MPDRGRMNEHTLPSADDERYGTLAMVRRLLTEQGLVHWRKYAVAFTLMAVSAACTALSAYLIGDVMNQTYVHRNLSAVFVLGGITAALFTIKGLATYGHSVTLSRIGNRIVADNQRAVFTKLLHEGLSFFSDRHSTEFVARLSTGAAACTQVINLLITAIGRDLLSLIGLLTVMVVQDPLMAFFSFVVAPPAFFVLRKLIRRIYAIARTQFHGGTRILETLQETLQGIRIVKAFTLEEIMRERFDRNVAAVEYEANKLARVSNRASPLMETLGGFAVAIAITYGGYRVLNTGAAPGEFFSFIAAFLLAYEPAKRLARLNIELNSGLVGVRILFEVLDSPPSEAADTSKPALQIRTPRLEFEDVHFAYRRRSGAARHFACGGTGQADRAGRPLRQRQDDDHQSDPALLRHRARQNRHRRAGHPRSHAPLVAPAPRLCRAGRVPVPRHDPRQHRVRQAGRQRGRDRGGRQGRLCTRFHPLLPTRLRHAGRRARPATVRRPAPARRHRARFDQERADHPARRSHRRARFGIRTAGARGHGASLPGPHHGGDRAPAAHGVARRPHLCDRRRPGG